MNLIDKTLGKLFPPYRFKMIRKEQNDLNLRDLEKLEDYLNENRTSISKSNYNYSQGLLKDIKKDLN